MTLTCLVLAGGKGTRMSSYTKSIPKILIPVGGRPFLHHQLDLLQVQGFKRIILSLGYLGSLVVDELHKSPHPDLSIEFMFDGDEPLGTGGAVKLACENLIFENHFFITYGDSYLLIEPRELIASFDELRYEALMSLYSNDNNLDISNAHISTSGEVSYKKNLRDPLSFGYNMIDFGISYVARESIMNAIPSNKESDLAEYFERLSVRRKLQGFVTSQRFYEIGSYAGRDELENYLSLRKGPSDNS